MLEPISPNYIPDKLPEVNEDKQLNPADAAGDSEGFSFNYFKRSKKRKQSKKDDESSSSSVYNQDNAVTLQLSQEARDKIQRQRELKSKRRKSQE